MNTTCAEVSSTILLTFSSHASSFSSTYVNPGLQEYGFRVPEKPVINQQAYRRYHLHKQLN
ncbi:hypothetical protein CW304_11135 [Bacillus sp. UFRGS-B20]|nr:hypothetical protein CW304_11135 [Bacillus sp. UFRGS-B20]